MSGFAELDAVLENLLAHPEVETVATPFWHFLFNSYDTSLVRALARSAADFVCNIHKGLACHEAVRYCPANYLCEIDTAVSGLRQSTTVHLAVVWGTYLPFLAFCFLTASKTTGRCLIGICGAAGTGKSTFCSISVVIAAWWNCDKLPSTLRSVHVATLSMDAYHLSNALLEAGGLRSVKGSLPTIDAGAMLEDMRSIVENPDSDIPLPEYDRKTTHDPVKDAWILSGRCQIVLVEGLYIARSSRAVAHADTWKAISSLLDSVVFINNSLEICCKRATERKALGGLTLDAATEYFNRVDRPIFSDIQNDIQAAALDRSDRKTVAMLMSVLSNADGTEISCASRIWTTIPCSEPAVEYAVAAASSALVVGLNPCVQRTLVFSQPWMKGDVNRVSEAIVTAGGKGQHCVKAIARDACYKEASGHVVQLFQVCAGNGGAQVSSRMKEEIGLLLSPRSRSLAYEQADFWLLKGDTRTCCTVLDVTLKEMTEFIEPPPELSHEERCEMVTALASRLSTSDIVAFMGTAPKGASGVVDELSTKIFQADGEHLRAPKFALLDLSSNVVEAVAAGGIDMLKVNVSELRGLAKLDVGEFCTSLQVCLSGQRLLSAAQAVNNRARLKFIGVTAGGDGAVLLQAVKQGSMTALRTSVFALQKTEVVMCNPIGAGDTVAGVLVSSLMMGETLPRAFCRGLAAGSASCETFRGAEYDPTRADEILAGIQQHDTWLY